MDAQASELYQRRVVAGLRSKGRGSFDMDSVLSKYKEAVTFVLVLALGL